MSEFPTRQATMKSLNELRDTVHNMAREKGWHDETRSFGDYIALMHSELSEALEEYRNGYETNEVYWTGASDKPEGIPIELADVIIRILDFCGVHGIDIELAVYEKIAYNATRPHRHGGKVI